MGNPICAIIEIPLAQFWTKFSGLTAEPAILEINTTNGHLRICRYNEDDVTIAQFPLQNNDDSSLEVFLYSEMEGLLGIVFLEKYYVMSAKPYLGLLRFQCYAEKNIYLKLMDKLRWDILAETLEKDDRETRR